MYIDSQEFFEFLKEQSAACGVDLIGILGADANTPFFVETVFLDGLNRELSEGADEDGLDEWEAYSFARDGQPFVEVHLSYHDKLQDYIEIVYMDLYPDPVCPGRYALQITRNDNLIYERTASQDERTEWLINGMAEDPNYQVDGEIAFHGDTTNI